MLTDWHLSYGNTDFAFGTIGSKFVFPQDSPPAVGTPDINHEDADRPRGDGIMFGTDFRGGTTVTFDVEVNGADETEAWALYQRFANVWRADEVRSTPGAIATLTSHTGRVTFGRPRRIQPKLDLTPFGLTAVSCDFATADDLWYGPQQYATVKLVPDLGGGLVAPLSAPLSTTATSDRSQTFTVDGLLPVWPTITLNGPITNPTIEVVGVFKMSFNVTLAADDQLIIDTRPWARSILRNGAGLAGALDPRTSRLSQASVPPGTYNLSLRGASATGTPQARIAWRNAYPTM